MFLCDFCREEDQTADAVALCSLCQKYLCNSCVKSHGKFLPDHTLTYGNLGKPVQHVKCKIHVNQVTELFCEQHSCVLCRFCKPLEHDHCSVRKICDIIKERNVEKEFNEKFESLQELFRVMDEKRNESQNKVETYSKDKQNIKARVKTLQKHLNDIFNNFENRLDSQQEMDVENLTANVQSYGNFCQELERQLYTLKRARQETSREVLFTFLIDANRSYKKYKVLLEKIETIASGSSTFTLKDEKMPGLLQELASISCLDLVPQAPGKVMAIDEPHPRLKLMIDQVCQTDATDEDHLAILQQDQRHDPENGQPVRSLKLKDDQIGVTDDDTECGSSEEMSELHAPGFFCNFKLFNLTATLSYPLRNLNKCGFMPDDDAVVCVENGIEVLDMDMTCKLRLAPKDGVCKAEHIAVVNEKFVVVSFPADELLQLVTILPKFELGKDIKLDCHCAGLKYFNKHFYIYTKCLDKSSRFEYSGFQVISRDGKVRKRIPLLDEVFHFSIKKSGDIIYFGNRAGTEHRFLKCISPDGTVLSEYKIQNFPDAVISDDDGNMISCNQSSGKIVALNQDGTEGSVLATIDKRQRIRSVSLSYNKYNHTFLVAWEHYYPIGLVGRWEGFLNTYKVEFL